MVTHASESEPKKLSWLWMALAVLLAVAAVGALWWWKAANSEVTEACKPENIHLQVGRSQTAESTIFTRVVLTNKGKTTCTLKGYPIASMLDERGENRFTGDAQHNNSYAEELVTLSPRSKANTVLGFPEPTNYREGTCGDMKTLRIYLPNTEILPGVSSLSTELRQKVCPGFSVTALRSGE